MRADIDSLMQGELGRWLAEQSDMRAAARHKAGWRWTWGAAIMMPVLGLIWFGLDTDVVLRSIVTLGGTMMFGLWGYQPLAEAKQTIKIGINGAIARSLGIEYAHDIEPGAEFAAAKRYGLVPKHTRASFEDHWHGTLEGHAFSLYETHLEERRGSGKNRHWVTVFRGVIITMAFGRPFHSTTVLQRAGKNRAWFGLGGPSERANFDGHLLDRVDQVHPDFANVFDLFGDDQVEARMLVHPAYIEHLLALEQVFGAKELRAIFSRGEVILVAASDNLFESGSMDEAQDRALAQQTAQQIAALADLALAINQTERGRVLSAARRPGAAP
jgi:hypothetical protein